MHGSSDSSDADDLGQDHSLSLHLKGASGSNTDAGEGCSGWKCEKDKKAQIYSKDTTYGTVRQSGRYFTEKTFYCGNCSMMGHLSRSCPDSKLKPCFICGALGHLGDKCPNNYCSNCYQPGHTSKTCSEIPCGKKQCQRCGMKGHFSDGCPEIWRQYHHTTSDAPPAPKQAEDKGQSSAYFGHACTKPRMSEDVFVHVPYINHYDTLEEIQRRQEERKAKAQISSEMQENCSLPFPASGTPPAQVLEENCDFPTEGKPKQKRRRKRNRKNKMIDGKNTEESQPF